jgi:hypothetical protein
MIVAKPLKIVWPITFFIALAGCGTGGPGVGPFGKPIPSALLAPFAGAWSLDAEKTFDAMKAAGATEADIEQIRKLQAANPQFAVMPSDMTISGNEAVCSGVPSAEYRFFAMHRHDGKIGGKAWHHEDRFDPGDMSKCYVRLSVIDNRLHFEVRMAEDSADPADPDLTNTPTPDVDSSSNCDAEKPASGQWSPWSAYVFNRRR